MKNKYIYVKDNDEVIYKIKKQHLAPAEMEFIHLKREVLDSCSLNITIEVGD